MYCSACLMFLMDSVMLKIICPGAVAEIYKLKQNYNLILLNRVLRSNKTGLKQFQDCCETGLKIVLVKSRKTGSKHKTCLHQVSITV